MIRRVLDFFIPSRRRARRAAIAEDTLVRVRAFVWRAANSARDRFREDHGKLPTRGDWKSTERAIRSWAATLSLMAMRGFKPDREIPRRLLDALQLEFTSIFVGEAPLPNEVTT